MSQEFLEQIQKAESEGERERLVLDFALNNLSPALKELVSVAAIPHWFDDDLLQILLQRDGEEMAVLKGRLLNFSFVETFLGRGYNVHSKARRQLLNRLWETDKRLYVDVSRRVAHYCLARVELEPAWRIEAVYHLLVAAPEIGIEHLKNTAREWHNAPNFAFDRVESLVSCVREHVDDGRVTGSAIGWIRYWEALAHFDYSRFRISKDLLLNIASRGAGPQLKADVHFHLGHAHRMLSEYTAAQKCYEDALTEYRLIGLRNGEANCTKALGDLHRTLANYAQAKGLFERASRIFASIADHLGEANCKKALGDIALRFNDYELARERYEAAVKLYKDIGSSIGVGHCTLGFAEVERMLGNWNSAEQLYRDSIAIYEKLANLLGKANGQKLLGDCYLMQKRYSEAKSAYELALKEYAAIGDRLGEANCLIRLSEVYQNAGKIDGALEACMAALDIHKATGNRFGEASGRSQLADLNFSLGRWEDAHADYVQALDYYKSINAEQNEALVLHRLGKLATSMKNPELARRYFLDAIEIFLKNKSPALTEVQEDLKNLDPTTQSL